MNLPTELNPAILALAAPIALLLSGLVPSSWANRHSQFTARLAAVAAWFSVAAAGISAVALTFIGGVFHLRPTGLAGEILAIQFDALSATMLLLVAFVAAIVIRFSKNYLAGDPQQGRFFKWLCLTTGSVLTLVISGNLLLFTAAWMATSLTLHQLLLFYPDRPAAQIAARKKFVISRLGDSCLLGAIAVAIAAYGTLDFPTLFAQADTVPAATEALAFLLVAGALLKSAQFPFHTWLPDTMETPTPVSALMHAGIINAGGFLVVRMSPIVAASGAALSTLMIVGSITALFASVVMVTQTSVKKSLAFSTVAQMGFMMLQCGLGAFSIAVLHIVAHSLYKAHAFLSSGSIVEITRSSWVPTATGRPHPGLLLLALGVAAIGAVAGSALFGVSMLENPGVVVLGIILMLGITHLLWNTWTKPIAAAVLARGVIVAVSVGSAYFLLHAAADHILGDSVAAATRSGPLELSLMLVITLTFALVLVAQAHLPYWQNSPTVQAAYVHASNGFSLSTLANRWLLRLWSVRKSA